MDAAATRRPTTVTEPILQVAVPAPVRCFDSLYVTERSACAAHCPMKVTEPILPIAAPAPMRYRFDSLVPQREWMPLPPGARRR